VAEEGDARTDEHDASTLAGEESLPPLPSPAASSSAGLETRRLRASLEARMFGSRYASRVQGKQRQLHLRQLVQDEVDSGTRSAG
jgi:hypothetical protein